ncbi:MAG TPA: hypothetical protein VFJ21_09870 [Mycobacteriales bacterium]|jgi:hypothetical protein|nr:hypothetical protein [Mycobacteriales bacterium]
MDGTKLARRYLPLAVVLALQALIITIVPSTAPGSSNTASGSLYTQNGTGGVPGSSGATGSSGSLAGAGGTATGAGAATGSSASGAGGTAGTGGGGAGGATPTGTAAGDTSHCVDGRQYDPKIDYYAPPCTPKFTGANGGNTYRGVTKDQIEVVWYVSDYGPEVNAILQAQGLYVSFSQAQAFNNAVEKFVNSHYELYGRKLHIDTYAGQCQSVPPDKQCLIPEMDTIVAKYHPYAVIWNTTLCSDCFAELARKGTVNLGGAGFSEAFNQAMNPYHWDVNMTGTRMMSMFANWWCSQMTSNNSSRVVKYAPNFNPAQNFNGKKRVLGVISTNDPDNQYTAQKILAPLLKQKCGEDFSQNQYYYDQNINTAAQQTQAGIAAMNKPGHPATTVLCLCDPVAPQFLYSGEAQNNYWPENVLATNQGMDADTVGQTYTSDGGLACPQSGHCPYDLAFGLSQLDAGEPLDNDTATRIWHLGGGQGNTPFESDTATTNWGYINMLMTMIQATGPDLTPQNMAAAAFRIPPRGGGDTGRILRVLAPDNHGWNADVRIVYWDKHQKSNVNGKPGHYVQIEGARKNGSFDAIDGPPMPMDGRH